MATTSTISAARQPFTLIGSPLLSKGQSMQEVARSSHMWIHAKIYAEGGENGVHAHPVEDHLFFVVAGEALFVDEEGTETLVKAFGGILMPAGNKYAFHAVSDENLVMLRVGTSTDESIARETTVNGMGQEVPAAVTVRFNDDGTRCADGDGKNGTVPSFGVPIPGSAFTG